MPAVAKPARIVDKDLLTWVAEERDGVCLYGLFTKRPCTAGLDPHHIKSKGSGGGDVPENLITLCRGHHNEAQDNLIPATDLRNILTAYFGYEYKE